MSTLRNKAEHMRLLAYDTLAHKHNSFKQSNPSRRSIKRHFKIDNRAGRPLVGLETQLIGLATNKHHLA